MIPPAPAVCALPRRPAVSRPGGLRRARLGLGALLGARLRGLSLTGLLLAAGLPALGCDALAFTGDRAAALMGDEDRDGWRACVGDASESEAARRCDCDDADAQAHPDAPERCLGDGADEDCDGRVDEGFDADGDGFNAEGDGLTVCGSDCDDGDPDISPGAEERCEGAVDEDCDGRIDEAPDNDGDGVTLCEGDCDDGDAGVYPGAGEGCDGRDEDCDGAVDEGPDADADGYTVCDGDCDEGDPARHPGALEVCDGIDQDCDDALDEGFDVDGDGVTTCAGDCDDGAPNIRPNLLPGEDLERCDGQDRDEDCDGAIDEGFDADGDGVTLCDGDCDDEDATIHSGAPEACGGVDEDCDGRMDEGFDVDGDGVTTCAGDCDDGDAEIHPWADERPYDGMDNDCDPSTPDDDLDGDGALGADDCDDRCALIHSGADERYGPENGICGGEGADDDCDGRVDEGDSLSTPYWGSLKIHYDDSRRFRDRYSTLYDTCPREGCASASFQSPDVVYAVEIERSDAQMLTASLSFYQWYARLTALEVCDLSEPVCLKTVCDGWFGGPIALEIALPTDCPLYIMVDGQGEGDSGDYSLELKAH